MQDRVVLTQQTVLDLYLRIQNDRNEGEHERDQLWQAPDEVFVCSLVVLKWE
jgi:hypothetical protein